MNPLPARAAALFRNSLSLAVVVLYINVLGRWLHLDILTRLSLTSMRYPAAFCMNLLALALILSRFAQSRWAKTLVGIFPSLTFALATITLYQYAFGSLPVGSLLYELTHETNVLGADDMILAVTAFNLCLMSLGLLCSLTWSDRLRKVSQFLFLTVLTIAVHSLLTSLIGVEANLQQRLHPPSAALCLIFFSLTGLALQTRFGFMRIFCSQTTIHMLAGPVIVANLFVPPLIYAVQRLGVQLGWMNSDLSVIVQFVGNTLLLTLILWRTTSVLYDRELQWRSANEDWNELFNLSLDLMCIADLSAGKFKRVNSAFERILGYSQDEILNRPLIDFVHPEDRESTQIEAQRVLKGRPSVYFENRYLCKDGHYVWLTWNSVASRGHFVYAIARDITERKKSHQALEKAKKEAESANFAKTQFLANMSHEIRTPLGIILGFAELAQESAEAVREHAAHIRTIARSARQLSHVVDQVLDLTRIETENLAIEKAEFNFKAFFDELHRELSPDAAAKQLRIHWSFDEIPPLHIYSDANRLKQILCNLVGNAIKFTEPGAGDIHIDCHCTPTQIEFVIRDHGVGIHAEQIPDLFKPFAQADTSLTRRFPGAGLGLMLSQRLARALGGDVLLIGTQPGKGTTIKCWIKLTPPPPKPKPAPPKPSLRILLVDDNTDNQKLMQTYLRTLNVETELASDGREGIAKALSRHFDLVLMDLQMPGLDGLQTTQVLRAQGFRRPIVAVTAHSLHDEIDLSLATLFDAFLTKPVEREHFLQTIRDLSGNSSVAHDSEFHSF